MLEYIIITAILIIIAIAITRLNRKDASIEMNKLVNYLGGHSNIKNIEVNKSRCKIELVDISLVNKEGIQKLGAQGIVEIDNTLKIILGRDARTLKKYKEKYILYDKKSKKKKKRKNR